LIDSKSNTYKALLGSLRASDQIGLNISFADGRVEWIGERPSFMSAIDALPVSFEEFVRNVNPADLPQLLSDIKPSNIDAVIDSYRIMCNFRYRFDNGDHVTLCLKGEVQANDNATFSGLLSACDTGVVAVAPVSPAGLDAVRVYPEGGHGYTERTHTTRRSLVEIIDQNNVKNANLPDDKRLGFLLLIGLDRLAMFNQAYGGNFVDALLAQVEDQLKAIFGGEETVLMRLSGDQYACFFPDQPALRMEEVARSLLDRLNQSAFKTLHGGVRLNASVGGVSLRERVKHTGDYIVMAEAALANAKMNGRGRFVAYARDRIQSALDIRKILKGADNFLRSFEEGRLKLAFQPVIRSRTKNDDVSFYECLLRMVDDQERIITAGQFMHQIEGLGLSHIADQFSLHQAVTELKSFPDLQLSVNVSPASLNDPAWLRSAISLLKDHPSIARRIVFEITETAAMQDLKLAKRVTKTLQDLGCRIALDDFGAGYSSFIQMKELSPDIVKIDKHFISEIEDPQNRIFIDAIQMLADGFDLETVGEGAETKREAAILQEHGVNNIQGYAYGYPSISRLWLPKGHDLRDAMLKDEENLAQQFPSLK